MNNSTYRRWPRACDYLGRPEIRSWWPRVQYEQYCIAPALNLTYFNVDLSDNPAGWHYWGQRLAFSDGLSWNYSHYTFADAPDQILYVLFQQVYDAFGTPVFSVKADIVRDGIWKTATGHRLFPMTGLITNPWASVQTIRLRADDPGVPGPFDPYITLWMNPVRLGLMDQAP